MSIHDFLGPSPDPDGLAAYLDGLDAAARIAAVRDVKPNEQPPLWDAVDGRTCTLDQFVPADKAPLEPVIHYGINTMPLAFLRPFEKRFCRPPGDVSDQLWGYNEFWLKGLTGPGYFITHPDQFDSVVIDYYEVPPGPAPTGWPAIKPNTGLLSSLIYGKMHDHMRPVSAHVTIGRATKDGKITNNFFMLCRES